MFKYQPVLICTAFILVLITSGCIKTSPTNEAIIAHVQAYLDAPADPSDVNALTVEERPMIESFRMVHNIIKIQFVEGTDNAMWETLGRKVLRAFAISCRREGYLEPTYVGQLFIHAEVDEETDNFKIGEFIFYNRNDRIDGGLFNPSRSRN
jgi:hypothetical protein